MYEVYKPTYQRAETELSVEEYLGDNFALKLECGRAVVKGDVNISSPGMENDKIEYNTGSGNYYVAHKITFRGVPYTLHVSYNEPNLVKDSEYDEDDDIDEDIENEVYRIFNY